jgi:hypothetical protein
MGGLNLKRIFSIVAGAERADFSRQLHVNPVSGAIDNADR